MTVLILGGTGEAHALSAALGPRAVVSLAHALETRAYTSPVRRGGFGGRAAQADWMRANRIAAVIDASHPFAMQISPRTAAISAELGLPYLRVMRPPWRPGAGDRWVSVADAREVAGVVPPEARVLLAVGAQHLEAFCGVRGAVFLRGLVAPDAPPFPLAGFIEDGPGDAEAERALFTRLDLTHIVTRNSGGALSGKLAAARELGLTVVMIERPPVPGGVDAVETPEAALIWLAGLGS